MSPSATPAEQYSRKSKKNSTNLVMAENHIARQPGLESSEDHLAKQSLLRTHHTLTELLRPLRVENLALSSF